ncbi:hypothetical protein [Thiolapillus sp.]|uniref:hypothetical protein n=1 Tax=Thiolapillus sp. TaxID=2017437 RepID=UPI003AF7CE3B
MNEQQKAARDAQLHMLIETVEQIRAEKYPDVPANLVKQMLLRHGDAAASETDLVRDLEKEVDSYLGQEG